jgi:ribosome maturation factor RimP
MSIETKIINLIEAPLNGLGYELLRIKQIEQGVLQVMIDSDNGVNIDDCVKATKLVNRILQVAEIEDYALEVSSPGIDRPLIKPEHYIKFIGNDIKLTTQIAIEGQKRFSGKLTNFDKDNNEIELNCGSKLIKIDFDKIQSANLQYIAKNNKK